MQRRDVPQGGAGYWVALSAASVFGANLGDTVSHSLHLGHVRGLPILALAFALVVAGERRSVRSGVVWYWSAIVILRTAATNLADLATHDLRFGWAGLIGVLAVLLAGVVAARGRVGGLERGAGGLARGAGGGVPGAGGRGSAAGGRGVPEVDGWYWVAMLVAGTLGTVLGDCASDGLGLGTGVATLCCGAGVAAVFVGRRWLRGAAGYWLPVVAIRTAGTTLGDFWVDGLALGLPVATACSGVAFVLAVVAGRAWATLGAGGGRGGFAGRPAGPGGASVP